MTQTLPTHPKLLELQLASCPVHKQSSDKAKLQQIQEGMFRCISEHIRHYLFLLCRQMKRGLTAFKTRQLGCVQVEGIHRF
jgi:hypothetical protein